MASAKKEQLSNIDALIWKMEDATGLVNVTGLMELDAIPDYETVLHIMGDRLLRFDRFLQKIEVNKSGELHWVKDELFNIKAHIHRIALPLPCDNDALQTLISDLMSQPLDNSKPLWQMHLIENIKTEKATLVARIHHSIGDGMSLIKVLFSLTHVMPELSLEDLPSFKPKKKKKVSDEEDNLFQKAWKQFEEKAGLPENFLGETKKILEQPQDFLEKMKNGLEGMNQFGKLLTRKHQGSEIYKGKASIMKRASWSGAFELKKIKEIRKITGATVNDVLLAAFTGAIANHMLHHDINPSEDFPIAMPVSLHKPDAFNIELANKIGALIMQLPVFEEDPHRRIELIKERSSNLKNSMLPIFSYGIANTLSGFTTKELEKKSALFIGEHIMASVSNVPGPVIPLYFAGKKVDDIMFWIPQTQSIGMGVSIVSYNGTVRLGITTDDNIVKDPEYLIYSFEEELQLMYEDIVLAAN